MSAGPACLFPHSQVKGDSSCSKVFCLACLSGSNLCLPSICTVFPGEMSDCNENTRSAQLFCEHQDRCFTTETLGSLTVDECALWMTWRVSHDGLILLSFCHTEATDKNTLRTVIQFRLMPQLTFIGSWSERAEDFPSDPYLMWVLVLQLNLHVNLKPLLLLQHWLLGKTTAVISFTTPQSSSNMHIKKFPPLTRHHD